MASLEEMLRAGYAPAKSPLTQITDLINGVSQAEQKRQEKEQKDVAEQTKLYTTLREAGYSQEDATAKVNRTYRSTGFIEKMVNGDNSNVFNQPTGEDNVALEQQKKKADIGKTKADAEKSLAQRDRMKNLTDLLSSPGANRQSEQIRKTLDSYIKRTYPGISAGAGTEEEQAGLATDKYVAQLENALNKSLALPADTAPAEKTQPKAAKYKAGQTVYYKGKPVKIKSINTDGTYNI